MLLIKMLGVFFKRKLDLLNDSTSCGIVCYTYTKSLGYRRISINEYEGENCDNFHKSKREKEVITRYFCHIEVTITKSTSVLGLFGQRITMSTYYLLSV